jgi:hypothetical protein
MNPRGLFGTCPVCKRPMMVTESLATTPMGHPPYPQLAHRACAEGEAECEES